MQFDFNLTSGQSQTLDVSGRFFKYKSGTGAIRVRATGGGYVDLLPGQGVFSLNFTSLTITDKSGAANVGVLLAGEYDFRDDRITGTVEVISGEKSRVIAGNSFAGSMGIVADPTFPAMVQLFNPAASGKNVFVNKIILGGTAAGEWIVSSTTTQLATLVGTCPNKKLNGAASSAERRREARAALGNTIFDLYATLNVPFDIVMVEPLMVPPGNGIVVYPATVNVQNVTNFQFYEDPI
jgi:hypothetical protein